MKKIILSSLTVLALSLSFVQCKKDKKSDPATPSTPAATTGSLSILFENTVDTLSLDLGTTTYTNAAGNTYSVTTFKYYISNIKITKNDNTVWSEPESYHLINAADPNSVLFTIPNVPFDTYKAIEFTIGVDSARNNSGAQTGALAQTNGMFWDWNTGYIFMKFEGTSPQSAAVNNAVKYHIGGFTGANSAIRVITPSFNGATANVTSAITPKIHMNCNLSNLFTGSNSFDFSSLNTVMMPGANAKKLADNYANMFSVEHIHND